MTDKPNQLQVSRREMNKALAGSPLILGNDDEEGGILEWLFGDDEEDTPPGITIVDDQGEVIADDISELEFDVSFDVQIDEEGDPRAVLSVPGAGDDNWGVGSDNLLRPSSNDVEGIEIDGSVNAEQADITDFRWQQVELNGDQALELTYQGGE